jgi:hypothetical protein
MIALRVSADEWLAVAALVRLPLPGIDGEALERIPPDVRDATIDAGTRGLFARGLLAAIDDQEARASGALGAVLKQLDRATAGLVVGIVRDSRALVSTWMWSDDGVVSQRASDDGALVELSILTIDEARDQVASALLLVDSDDSHEPPFPLSSSSLEQLREGIPLDGSGSFAEATRAAGAPSYAQLVNLEDDQLTETRLSWIDGHPGGIWLIEPHGDDGLEWQARRVSRKELLDAVLPRIA